MQSEEIKMHVHRKRFLIDAFLHTASLPSGTGSKAVLRHSVTVHFLQAIVLELIVKMLYELDLRKSAPFTHNLTKLFNELSKETKDYLVAKFDEARDRRRQQFSTINDVEFHSFQIVLANNEKTVINFKYDAKGVPSNSSADDAFYMKVFEYIDSKVGGLNV